MLRLEIEGVDELKKWAETDFVGRANAVKKLLLRRVVEQVFNEIVKDIPTGEHWLKKYRNSIKVFEMKNLPKNEYGFSIAARVSGDWTMADAEKMIVYFDSIARSPDRAIGDVLEKYSPFTVNNVPSLDPHDYGATVSVRRVRSDEIKEVRKANERHQESIRSELDQAGATFVKGPAKIGRKVFFDLDFAVMRMELGFGDVKKPHWRPALRKISLFLEKMERDVKVHKILAKYFTPEDDTWKSELDRTHPQIEVREVENFEEFQDKIYPRIL